MHCGNCGNTTDEVRPCFIKHHKDTFLQGDSWICRECALRLAPHAERGSDFTTWIGYPCDVCRVLTAFDGDIPDMPEGIVCDQCEKDSLMLPGRGTWLCTKCYDRDHYGHRQKQLQPILERLAKL